MSKDEHLTGRCDCQLPLHNLLVCAGPVCVKDCPVHDFAERHGLIGGTRQRYEGES